MMRSVLECRIRAPDVSTVRLESALTSGAIYSSLFSVNLSPVTVEGTKVSFSKDMEVGKWYPFSYKNETYLAVRNSETVIDIYRVKK